MNGDYQLVLTDGTIIPMRFCTWTLKRFMELQKCDLQALFEKATSGLAVDFVANMMRAAAEYPRVKNRATIDFGELEVCDWIDDVGGLLSAKVREMVVAFMDSLKVSEALAQGAEEKKSASAG